MAGPKVHAVPTGIIAIIALIIYTPLALLSSSTAILLLVLFLGVFMDIDHLSIRRIKKIRRGEKGPVEGWVDWMHTWQALVGIIILSVIIFNILPIASYLVHILIDSGNRSNIKYPDKTPLPGFIHQFYPRWMTYETKFVI